MKVIILNVGILNEHSARLVTISQNEYEIMRLKEEELPHDRSIIEATLKQMQETESAAASNLKRENKTYTYKEQMADLELKKELEKKKKTTAEQQQQQQQQQSTFNLDRIRAAMSKKQQEQLDTLIKSEIKVREELRRLDEQVRKASEVLMRVVQGNSFEAKLYMAQIVRTLVRLVKSPLCTMHVIGVLGKFVEFDYCDENQSHLNFYMAAVFCTVRLAGANALTLETRWTREPLHEAFPRILFRLRNETVADSHLDLSKATFFYPFLKVSSHCFFFFLLGLVSI